MTQAAIATDVHQTFNVHLNALSEIAFDIAFSVEERTYLIKIVFAMSLILTLMPTPA